jgi:chaperone protein EcpD
MNVKPAFKSFVAAGLIALAFATTTQANASVVIAGTRVIYNQKDSEVTLKLSNTGESPALVQVWIDKGDPKVSPSAIDVPFTVTPPASRIDPGKGQTLRIIRTGESLAQDRESVFWLNVLEIPPKPSGDAADSNQLQLAFRSRIKLFYRPAGLKGDAQEAPSQLAWHLTSEQGHPVLQASNRSAYDVSLTAVEVIDGSSVASFDDGGMLTPGETKSFPLKGAPSTSPSAKVRYHALNDYGGAVTGEAPLR